MWRACAGCLAARHGGRGGATTAEEGWGVSADGGFRGARGLRDQGSCRRVAVTGRCSAAARALDLCSCAAQPWPIGGAAAGYGPPALLSVASAPCAATPKLFHVRRRVLLLRAKMESQGIQPRLMCSWGGSSRQQRVVTSSAACQVAPAQIPVAARFIIRNLHIQHTDRRTELPCLPPRLHPACHCRLQSLSACAPAAFLPRRPSNRRWDRPTALAASSELLAWYCRHCAAAQLTPATQAHSPRWHGYPRLPLPCPGSRACLCSSRR